MRYNFQEVHIDNKAATLSSSIEETAGMIALKIESGDVTTSSGKVVAGIEIGEKDEKGYIKLKGDEVIVEESISAKELKSSVISGKSFLVGDGGSIRSSSYSENGVNVSGKDGFYLNSDGLLRATKAFFKNATAEDLEITGGDINSNSLQTIKETKTSDDDNYSSVKSRVYYAKADVESVLECSDKAYLISASDVTEGTSFTVNGVTYKLRRNISALYETGAYYSQTLDNWNGKGTITFSVPAGVTKIRVYVPCQGEAYYSIGDMEIEGSYTYDEYRNYTYSLNGAAAVTSYATYLELDVNPGATNTIIFTPVHEAGTIISSGSSSRYTYRRSVINWDTKFEYYRHSVLPDGSSVSKAGIYLFKSTTSWVRMDELSLPSYVSDTSLPIDTSYYKYTNFANSSGSSLQAQNCQTKNVTIGGVSQSDGTLSYGNGSLIIRDGSNSVVLSVNTNDYYKSEEYRDASFTIITMQKGVYVTDLYPKLDSGNTEADIGSSNQKFNKAYIREIESDTITAPTLNGSATSAGKLTSDGGSDGYPVYFVNGLPVACTKVWGALAN